MISPLQNRLRNNEAAAGTEFPRGIARRFGFPTDAQFMKTIRSRSRSHCLIFPNNPRGNPDRTGDATATMPLELFLPKLPRSLARITLLRSHPIPLLHIHTPLPLLPPVPSAPSKDRAEDIA
jgi:hypothetical protein